MSGHFIHHIDPIIFEIGGVCIWWYGLSYALGYLETFLWLKRTRQRTGLTVSEAYTLTIVLALGLLIGARLVEVFFYEWPYFSAHPWRIPDLWQGGMVTHGVLLGGLLAILLFCAAYKKSFLLVADALSVPGAFMMGMGRIGNFIDGQIVGSVTHVWWAVQFPDVPGFRHPVVLYDSLKNFLIIPILLIVRKRSRKPGMEMAHFIFWYGFLRIFVDMYRDYGTWIMGIPTGQVLNIFTAALGGGLVLWFWARGKEKSPGEVSLDGIPSPRQSDAKNVWVKRTVLATLMLFSLIIPSDSTQDIPARYGKRHEGLNYSILYPHIEAPPEPNNPMPSAAERR
jgi:phosphatidylglycerol---prolipoprotein diacylglyceryl transferase